MTTTTGCVTTTHSYNTRHSQRSSNAAASCLKAKASGFFDAHPHQQEQPKLASPSLGHTIKQAPKKKATRVIYKKTRNKSTTAIKKRRTTTHQREQLVALDQNPWPTTPTPVRRKTFDREKYNALMLAYRENSRGFDDYDDACDDKIAEMRHAAAAVPVTPPATPTTTATTVPVTAYLDSQDFYTAVCLLSLQSLWSNN
jgi:hypothetical protein